MSLSILYSMFLMFDSACSDSFYGDPLDTKDIYIKGSRLLLVEVPGPLVLKAYCGPDALIPEIFGRLCLEGSFSLQ